MRNYLKSLHIAIANMIDLKEHVRTELKKELIKQLRLQEVKKNAKNRKESGIQPTVGNEPELIVSLTTHSKRIYQVHLVIETLMEQTLKPNRIVLWLDENEFTHDELPFQLLAFEEKGLEISFCKNLRSYKKLIPTLYKYPKANIITVDDDILYPEDLVERLYSAYKKVPKNIWYTRGHRIKMNGEVMAPYRSWDLEKESKDVSPLNFPTGCGGILYPIESLDKEVFNEEAFMSFAPMADDVWFKAMSLKKGTACSQISIDAAFSENFIDIDAAADIGLSKVNLERDKNDPQIKSVFTKYNLYRLLCQK